MSNKSIALNSTKEEATKVFYLLPDEFEGKLKKQTEHGILEELRFMAYRDSDEKKWKKIEKRMLELGFSFDPLVG